MAWLTRERVTTLVLVAATVIAFYLCYRLALPFLPAVTWALALSVVAQPLHNLLPAPLLWGVVITTLLIEVWRVRLPEGRGV